MEIIFKILFHILESSLVLKGYEDAKAAVCAKKIKDDGYTLYKMQGGKW